MDSLFEVVRYSSEKSREWNQFVGQSKNGTFLLLREYMDYHADRFHDFSLMIYRKGKLYALLPANLKGDTLYSHQGLTYGGVVLTAKANTVDVYAMFLSMNQWLKSMGIVKVVYKCIPYIYHRIPSQEDLYALFRLNAKITGRNISSSIYQSNKVKFIESRKSGIRKAKTCHVEVKQSEDYAAFWDILDTNLKNKYGVAPVHTLSEIELLHSRFPDHIKLYLAFQGDEPLGGTVLYISGHLVHTQYISASIKGKEIGALDLLFDELINHEYAGYPVFDFGQSTENMGSYLNESLIFQKEGFGGRGVCYDIYEYDL